MKSFMYAPLLALVTGMLAACASADDSGEPSGQQVQAAVTDRVALQRTPDNSKSCADGISGLKLRQRPEPGGVPQGPDDIGSKCPEGTFLSPFEMPIYDSDGKFVIGYETVYYCLPIGLEPAG